MLNFAARRLLAAIPTLLVVTLLVFALVRLLPGDPARLQLGEEATPQALTELRHQMGLDRPVAVQYLQWLADLSHLNLGRSLQDHASVAGLIAQKLPTTFELSVLSLLVAVALALPAGIFSALRPGSVTDRLVTLLALSGISLPSFFLGILLVYLFSVQLAWIPASGYVDLSENPALNLKLMLLPAVTLGVGSGAVLTRFLRGSLLEVLSQDYVRTARAKGITGHFVVVKHALRNALIPVVTVLGLQLGGLLGGAVVTEQIFSVPGFGRLLVDAVFTRDLPVIQGMVLTSAALVLVVSFVVDLLYGMIDPRVRYA